MELLGGVSLAVLLLLGLVGRCMWAWPTSNHFPIALICFFFWSFFSLFLQTSATNKEQRPLLEKVHDSVAGSAGLLKYWDFILSGDLLGNEVL